MKKNESEATPIMMSVVILARDAENHLPVLLEQLRPFAEVMLFLDDRTTDRSAKTAASFKNVVLKKHTFNGFGQAKREAVEAAHYDWIFSIDTDERPDTQLLNELKNLSTNKAFAYQIDRHNHYRKRWIAGAGWSPDFVLRVFHREVAQFSKRLVHESVQLQPHVTLKTLPGSLKHFSFAGAAGLIDKLQHYTDLYAQQEAGHKKSKGMLAILFRSGFTFFKFYVLKKGFLYGRDGFIISWSNALGAMFKQIKLAEANERLANERLAKEKSEAEK